MSLILLAFCGLWGITAPIHFSHPQKSAVFTPQNCPHCGQKWSARRKKAPGFSPASPLAALLSVRNCPQVSFFCAWRSRNAPARRRNVRFFAPSGYAPGCARKIGHSRDTRLTRADRCFSAVPVGTLPTAFGCVPARIPRPALQASARKTAGWKTEWAGACTEGFRSACVRPA